MHARTGRLRHVRPRVRFTTSALAVGGIAMLILSCGDGAVGPTTPPSPPPAPAAVPSSVTVNPDSHTFTALGETARFAAEVRDENGQVLAGAAVAWASGDPSVAAVDASGQVTAAGNGTTTITARAGSASGTAEVTVTQEVRAVAVSPATDTLVAFGDTARLAAEATDANGHGVAGAEVSWSSSDTLVARVDDAGLVESAAAGAAVVTATASGMTGQAALTVVPPVPTTVVVSPDTVRFAALQRTEQLAAEVRDQAGRAMAEVPVSWSSGDTLVAVVDSAGRVTAAGAGTTVVTATAGSGESGVSGDAVVSVMQAAGSVTVSPAQGTIALGDTLRLAAEAFDENGHRVEDAVFSWSSSDAGVARVDGTGLVEAVAEGAAEITATAGDASGTAEITVANPDRAALVALYEATDGPNWTDSENWLTDAPLGTWYGVETDGSGRVVDLNLESRWDSETATRIVQGLSGPVPPQLGSLGQLRSLDLSFNNLTGPIPPELGGLENLAFLDLSRNGLSGSIPPELGTHLPVQSTKVY